MYSEAHRNVVKSRKVCMHVCSVASAVSSSVTLWTVALGAPPSMGFAQQEYWSGLPRPPPGDCPDPGIESTHHLHCRQILYC